jgi:hypothetical protein
LIAKTRSFTRKQQFSPGRALHGRLAVGADPDALAIMRDTQGEEFKHSPEGIGHAPTGTALAPDDCSGVEMYERLRYIVIVQR